MEVLKLKGTPRHCGRIHGESYCNQIRELIEIRQGLISKFLKKFNENEKQALFARQVRALQRYPNLYEEFQGIAESAQVSENDLMVLNNYTDMRDFIHADPNDEGCSIYYVKNSKGTSTGQTWDMHASATPYVLNLEIEENESTLQVVTVMGCLALAGVNSHGVCVLINNMHCAQTQIDGIMWPGIVRLMLSQANSANKALQVIKRDLPSSGHNYLISDKATGYNIETTGTQLDVTKEINKAGYTFHTNHYVGRLKIHEILERQSQSTHPRYEALEKLFSGNDWSNWSPDELSNKIFVEEAAKILCIAPTPGDPHRAATCGGISYNHTERKGLIFKGLYKDEDHKSFKF